MIGKMERVDLRKVWKNEVKDFSSWLFENIEILAEELDIDVPYLGGFGTESTKLLELVGNEILEGTIYTSSIYNINEEVGLMGKFNQKSQTVAGMCHQPVDPARCFRLSIINI